MESDESRGESPSISLRFNHIEVLLEIIAKEISFEKFKIVLKYVFSFQVKS